LIKIEIVESSNEEIFEGEGRSGDRSQCQSLSCRL